MSFFDSDIEFRDKNLESTFFHEIGHLIANRIYLKSIENEEFKNEITIIPNYGESYGATLVFEKEVPSEFRIAMLFYGCIFEQLYNVIKSNEKPNLWSCWYAFSGQGSADFDMVQNILKNLEHNPKGADIDSLLAISEEYLNTLIKNSNQYAVNEIIKIDYNLSLELIKHDAGDYYKLNSGFLNSITNFVQQHSEIFMSYVSNIRTQLK